MPATIVAQKAELERTQKIELDKREKRIVELESENERLKASIRQAFVEKKEVAEPVASEVKFHSIQLAELTRYRDQLLSGGEGPELVALPQSEFGYEFSMGRTEVTVKEYLLCVDRGACSEPEWRNPKSRYFYKNGADKSSYISINALEEDSPITGVSWDDAVKYVNWLSKETGSHYKLPSENEWEKACLAGEKTEYCGGNSINELGWTIENSDGKLHSVGSAARGNKWGLYDMSGNVWEWLENCKDATCNAKALRGGSWYFYAKSASVANRSYIDGALGGISVGFRVAKRPMELNKPFQSTSANSVELTKLLAQLRYENSRLQETHRVAMANVKASYEKRIQKLELENERLKESSSQAMVEKKDVAKSVASDVKLNSNHVAELSRYRDQLLSGGEGPEMVVLPQSAFGYRFSMGRTEVTVKEYLLCVERGACSEPVWREPASRYHYKTGSEKSTYVAIGALEGNRPITGISWDDAVEYVKWLSKETKATYKLPSEKEWLIACLSSEKTEYCGGNNANELAWTLENSGSKLHPVGTTPKSNKWGLYDMSGNLWEWMENCYDASCNTKAVRGGLFDYYSSLATAISRYNFDASRREYYIGFRVARTH